MIESEAISLSRSAEGLPGPGELIVPLLVIALLIAVNGLFVAAEFALLGTRKTQMEEQAEGGRPSARFMLAVLRAPRHIDQYIATAQLGITLASLGLGMYGEPRLARFLEPYLALLTRTAPSAALLHTTASLIVLGLLTYLHVVLGEMVPKTLALAAPARMALALAPSMRVAEILFRWPVRLLNGIGVAMLRLARIPPSEGHTLLHSPEELDLIVAESAGGGLLNEGEEELLHNILDFGARQAGQVMTPRLKVEALPHDASLADVLRVATESRRSRFPVYEGTLDNILGGLHVKDLVRHQTRTKGTFDLRLLLRPIPAVPESFPVDRLLAAFRRQRAHMAVVLDEYGGTAGIVTLEDLVEEIVGEVQDEFDQESESLVRLAPGVIEAAGTVPLDDLREYVEMGAERDLPDVETVGGLIMALLDCPPRAGDQVVSANGVRFTVLAVEGMAVGRARVESQEEGGSA